MAGCDSIMCGNSIEGSGDGTVGAGNMDGFDDIVSVECSEGSGGGTAGGGDGCIGNKKKLK